METDELEDDFGLFPSQDDTPTGGGPKGNVPDEDDDEDVDPKEQIRRLKLAQASELETVRAELETIRRNIPQQPSQPQNPYAFAPAAPQADYRAELARRFDEIAATKGLGAAMVDQTEIIANINRQTASAAAAPVAARQAQMAIEMYKSAKKSDPYWPVASKHFQTMLNSANLNEVSRLTPQQQVAAMDAAYEAAIGKAVVEKRRASVPSYGGGGGRPTGGNPFRPGRKQLTAEQTETLRIMREDNAMDEKTVAQVMKDEYGLGKGDF